MQTPDDNMQQYPEEREGDTSYPEVLRSAVQSTRSAANAQTAAEITERKKREPWMQKEVDIAEQQAADTTRNYEERRLKTIDQVAEMKTLGDEMAASQIHDRWAESSTPLKIGALIAMGLGSAVQSIYKDKTNIVSDQIESAIQRDLGMQKLRLDKAKGDYANKNLLLARTREMFGDEDQAMRAAYLIKHQVYQAKLKQLADSSKDERIGANYQKLAADGELKAAVEAAKFNAQQTGALIRAHGMEEKASRSLQEKRDFEDYKIKQEEKARLGRIQQPFETEGFVDPTVAVDMGKTVSATGDALVHLDRMKELLDAEKGSSLLFANKAEQAAAFGAVRQVEQTGMRLEGEEANKVGDLSASATSETWMKSFLPENLTPKELKDRIDVARYALARTLKAKVEWHGARLKPNSAIQRILNEEIKSGPNR